MSSVSETGHDTIEIYNPEEHYPIVKRWWEERLGEAIPETQLPSPGVIVSRGGERVAAMWTMLSNSNGVGFLLWPVTSPEAGISGVRGLSTARDFLEEHAKGLGYHTFWFITERDALGRTFKRNGYKMAQTGETLYVKPLWLPS